MTEEIKKNKTYTDLKIEKLPGSEVEFTGEIPVEFAETYRAKAIRKVTKNIELPGFRKGHVPEEMAIEHIGEVELMKEIAELALGQSYADIVTDEKIDAIGRPQVTITKLAKGNPIGFKIKSAVFPKIELPDYKKIAEAERKKFEKTDKMTVSDEEVEKELKRLQEMMTPTPNKKQASKSSSTKNDEKAEKPVPPEINDEFAKNIGGFESLDDLKKKMKEQMFVEKENKEKEKKRLTLAESVINKSKVEVPNLFIEGELDQMMASFADRVKRAGMEMDVYLKQADKNIEDLRKEWRTDAEKRAKLQLVFNEIAKKEMITPDSGKLLREVEHIKEHYPDADKESVAIYVTAQMTNEKVFEFLEGKEIKNEEETFKKDQKEKEEEVHVHGEGCDHKH